MEKRKDAICLLELFKRTTKEPAVMWGESIGFLVVITNKYDSWQEGDMSLTGFFSTEN